jgi:hypothetical protein
MMFSDTISNMKKIHFVQFMVEGWDEIAAFTYKPTKDDAIEYLFNRRQSMLDKDGCCDLDLPEIAFLTECIRDLEEDEGLVYYIHTVELVDNRGEKNE